jgi:peptidoglycan/LPS O-acetylase OafA/YrhL
MSGDEILVGRFAGTAVLALVVATVLVVASVSYRLVETPGRQFGRRLIGGVRRPAAPTVPAAW